MKVSIVTVFAAAFVAVAGVSLVDAETATGRGRGGSHGKKLPGQLFDNSYAKYQRIVSFLQFHADRT
ncbi:hypothetical protein BDF22DRAFT_745792 [Syncephalis plumigaleata]|nr:hypothetical protein BDF22DRAFT_745792 [Syncephalis plumigaleata]